MIWRVVFWLWFFLPVAVMAWQADFALKMLGALVVLFFWYLLLGWCQWKIFWQIVDGKKKEG